MDFANLSLLHISYYSSTNFTTTCFKNVSITPEQKVNFIFF